MHLYICNTPRLSHSPLLWSIKAAAQALWPYKYVILAAFLGSRYLLEAKKQPNKNIQVFLFFTKRLILAPGLERRNVHLASRTFRFQAD